MPAIPRCYDLGSFESCFLGFREKPKKADNLKAFRGGWFFVTETFLVLFYTTQPFTLLLIYTMQVKTDALIL